MRPARQPRPGRRRHGPCIALAVALAAAGAVRADDADPDGVRAGDSAPDAPDITRRVPAVVVRDLEPEDLPEDPAAFTTVIELDDYAGEARTLEDLLSQTVGVQVRRFGSPGQPAEVSIRGSTSNQVVVLLDGVRLDSALSGTVDLSTLPVDLLERVEVTRGGGSVQQGTGAIGGVVNLVTRRSSSTPRTRLAGELASFGTGEGSAYHARREGPWDLVAAYDGFTARGDFEFQRPVLRFGGATIVPDPPTLTRINNRVESHSGLLRVGRDLGERLHLSLQNDGFFTSRGQPGLDSGVGAFGGQQPDAHQRLVRNLAALSLAGADLTPLGLELDAHLFHRFQRNRFKNPQPTVGAPIDVDQRIQGAGGRFALEKRFDVLGTGHRLSVGFEGSGQWLDDPTFGDPARRTLDLFAQDELALLGRAVRVVPGFRLDATSDFPTRAVPRVGVVLEPWSWLRVKGSWEEAYRVPTFDELFLPDEGFLRGNPGLRPEQATLWDAGVELGFAGPWPFDRLRLEGAWFHNAIDESIVFVLINPFTVAPVNTGPATVDGFELAASASLLGWVSLQGSYTRVDARFDANDVPLPGRARDEVSARLQVGPPSQLVKLFLELQHTGRIPVSETGNTVINARTTYDGGIVVDLVQAPGLGRRLPVRQLLASFVATNFTDVSVRDALFFPQPGRMLFVRLETVF